MKKLILVVGVFYILLNGSCRSRTPRISYESNIVNLGVIEIGKVFSGKIVVKNMGEAVLKIDKIIPDCTCTITNIEKKEIDPKDSTYINFNIRPTVGGLLQQNIIVDNNSENENRVLFLIRAKVHVTK